MVAPPPGDAWAGPGFPGDFDGDLDVDLLVDAIPGAGYPGTTHLLRNLGCGVFVDAGPAAPSSMRVIPSVANPIPQEPGASFVSDLDGDGDQDFVGVVVDPNPFVPFGHSKVWWNQGGGVFQAGQDLISCVVAAAGEMTQDGIIDILVLFQPRGASFGQLLVLPGLGGGAFATPGSGIVVDADTNRVNAPALADFDGDGDLDVFSVGNVSAKLIPNAGGGVFGPSITYPSLAPVPVTVPFAPSARRALAVDIDLDGLVDVVTTRVGPLNLTASMLRDGPGGSFGTIVPQLFFARTFADVDGDGDQDALEGRLVTRNVRHSLPTSGARLQYGTGIPGSGGITPILGETGPFRPLSMVELRITGGLGGAGGIIAFGTAPAKTPLFGGTLLVTPSFTIPIQLGGSPGVAGTGLRAPGRGPAVARRRHPVSPGRCDRSRDAVRDHGHERPSNRHRPVSPGLRPHAKSLFCARFMDGGRAYDRGCHVPTTPPRSAFVIALLVTIGNAQNPWRT